MKNLKYNLIVISLIGLLFLTGCELQDNQNMNLQGRTSNFWKTVSNKYQTITDKAVNITGDLEFQDEIKPDGALCSAGQILKKTGADNWDCVADSLGSSASTTQLTVSDKLWAGNILTTGNTISATNNSGLRLYDNASKGIFVEDGGKVGIGTTAPSQKLDLVGNLELEITTSDDTGVIYKGADRFIHNFQHPTGNTAVPAGYNTFIGVNAGNFTMGSTATQTYHGSYNTGMGTNALRSNTTGHSNSAMGMDALRSNTTGYSNSAIGRDALYSNTTGYYNFVMGKDTLRSNTTGHSNSAMGTNALRSNTTGHYNSAIGRDALRSNTTGYYNSAMGKDTLRSNTTGHSNSAMGRDALYSNTTGHSNSAIGRDALRSNTTGHYNSAIGRDAGRYIADGSTANTTGDYNVFLGYNIKALADNDQNEIVIGYDAIGAGSNSVTLGSTTIATTVLQGKVGIGTASPDTLIHIYDATATSTAYIESGGAGLGGMIIIEDTGGGACTAITTSAGTITEQL